MRRANLNPGVDLRDQMNGWFLLGEGANFIQPTLFLWWCLKWKQNIKGRDLYANSVPITARLCGLITITWERLRSALILMELRCGYYLFAFKHADQLRSGGGKSCILQQHFMYDQKQLWKWSCHVNLVYKTCFPGVHLILFSGVFCENKRKFKVFYPVMYYGLEG